jgi:hypothetical protein
MTAIYHCPSCQFQVVFQSFNFEQAVSSNSYQRNLNKVGLEDQESEWMDGLSRCGLSVDGNPIIYSFPSLLNEGVHVSDATAGNMAQHHSFC